MKYGLLLPLAGVLLASCAERTPPAVSISGTWFNCENGLVFATERTENRMIIKVADGQRFELRAAPTSIGELYRSSDTILRIDDDFAVLAGGPVQDYTRCRQMNSNA
jgi:hypothetical protein